MPLGQARQELEMEAVARLGKLFVNRQAILEEWDQRLRSSNGYLVLNFYGMGGQGKSSLLDVIAAKLNVKAGKTKKSPPSSIAWSRIDFSCSTDPIAIFLEIASQLEEFGLQFPLFYFALIEFYRNIGSRELAEQIRTNRILKYPQFVSLASELSIDIANCMAFNIPGMVWKVVRKGLENWQEKQRKNVDYIQRFLRVFSDWDKAKQQAELGLALYYDLVRMPTRVQQMIFLCDTAEVFSEGKGSRYNPVQDGWFRAFVECFTSPPKADSPPLDALFVIAGREALRWEQEVDPEWVSHIHKVAIENLAKEDCGEYLKQGGVPLPLHSTIYQETNGYPLAVYMLALRYLQLSAENAAEQTVVPTELHLGKGQLLELYHRVIRHLPTEACLLLGYLAFCSWFNEEICANVAQRCQVSWGFNSFTDLLLYIFVQNIKPGRFRIHDSVAEAIRTRGDTGAVHAHILLLEVFRETAKKGGCMAGEYLREATRQALAVENPQDRSWALEQLEQQLTEYQLDFVQRTALEFRGILIGEERERLNGLLGKVWWMDGKFVQAISVFEETLENEVARLGEENVTVAATNESLGSVWLENGNLDKAMSYLQKALQIRRKFLGDDHAGVASSCTALGVAISSGENPAQAIPLFEKALAIRLELYGETHHEVAECYNSLGVTYLEIGDLEKAQAFLEKSLSIIRQDQSGHMQLELATLYNNLGVVYRRRSDFDQAIHHQREALRIWVTIYGEDHPDVATCYQNLGSTYLHTGQTETARFNHQIALRIRQQVLGENHWLVGRSLYYVGDTYLATGDRAMAMQCFNRALTILQAAGSMGKPEVKIVQQRLVEAGKESCAAENIPDSTTPATETPENE